MATYQVSGPRRTEMKVHLLPDSFSCKCDLFAGFFCCPRKRCPGQISGCPVCVSVCPRPCVASHDEEAPPSGGSEVLLPFNQKYGTIKIKRLPGIPVTWARVKHGPLVRGKATYNNPAQERILRRGCFLLGTNFDYSGQSGIKVTRPGSICVSSRKNCGFLLVALTWQRYESK